MSESRSYFPIRTAVVASVLGVFSALGIFSAVTSQAQAFNWSKLNPMSYMNHGTSTQVSEKSAAPQKTAPEKHHNPVHHAAPKTQDQGALIETEKGSIGIELFPKEAPITVANFEKLVERQFYNVPSMAFHRVVPGFVIQTGDPTATGMGGSEDKIPLEVKNKLAHNAKGIVSMARSADPDSASSQFYITLAPQASLDGKYAVFGKVVSGLDVLDKIQQGDRVYGVKLVDAKSLTPDPKPKKHGATMPEALKKVFH